ncbi:MAG TPA: hypothetical protein VGD80_30515, partial [Kofleriaceae bacterium]
ACTASSACGAGQYCNAEIGACLPGSGPPLGGIVTVGTPAAAVSSELRSAQIAAWSAPLASVAAANPGHLGGPDALSRLGRAYCYRSPQQPGPASLAGAAVEPSLDLACADGLPQGALGFANRIREVETSAQGGVTFDLLEACRADLDAQPTAPATAAHLLDAHPCVSLGRLFLALDAAAAAPPALEPQRLVMQLARQWLGANAFAATSAVQHQALSDALDATGSPAHVTLGDAVDRMERAWRVLFDPKVQAQLLGGPETGWAVGHPDYRVPARPVAQWSFNSAPPGAVDVEGGVALDTIGRNVGKLAVPGPVAPSMGTCETQGPVAVSTHAFSITTYLEYFVANTTFTLFEKTGPDRFWIDATMGASGPIRFDMRSASGATATFTLPWAPSLAVYAFVFDGANYRITRFLHTGTTTTFAPTSVTGPPAAWGAPGPVRLGCTVPHPGALHGDYVAYDDVAIWDRAVTEAELTAMGTRYAQIKSSLADRPIVPAGEQGVGLPVHILEAAGAHIDLLSAYLEAERAAMYDECYLGGASPARDRALARTGRALRMIPVAERQAAALTELLESQPAWLARYDDAHHAFAAKHNEIVEVVRRVQSCSNPLGITENDLPLYQGNAVGASERFFASSRFLTAQARGEITASNDLLQLARNAYLAQRQSAYQVALSATDKAARLDQLRLSYDNQLRRFCGAPADGSSLLDAFLAGTLTAGNCYLTESCRTLAGAPLRQLPPSCLRGEIGERLVAIQAAALDAERAKANY